MFRDILVHPDGGQASGQRARFAVDLAKRFGARLTGVHVTPHPDVPPLFKAGRVDDAAASIGSRLVSDACSAAAILDEEVTQRMIDASWFQPVGDIVQGINERARYADLVILGQYKAGASSIRHPLPIAHSVVMYYGRPVLVVPPAIRPGTLARVAVAWDGSREAVRAVHDALPLLRLSPSVRVRMMVSASVEGSEADAHSLSSHPAGHGIQLNVHIHPIASAEENQELPAGIEQGLYDLLVMSGYAHPPWLAFIFGGVSNSIPLTSTISVLLSH